LAQRGADQLLHHEERQAVAIAADLVDRDDRGVLEAALDRRFAEEPADRALAGRRGAHPLDRDLAADLLVPRSEDLTHAAAADPAEHPVASGEQRGRFVVHSLHRRLADRRWSHGGALIDAHGPTITDSAEIDCAVCTPEICVPIAVRWPTITVLS